MAFLRRLLPAAIAAVFLLACSGGPVDARPHTSPAVAEVLKELNAVRTRRGLVPLRLSRPLSTAADFHTRDMGAHGYFSHTSRDGTAFWRRVRRYYPSQGYRLWLAGENLLWMSGPLDARTAVQMWMRSPGHRANILGRRWREIGISSRSFSSAPGTYRNLPVTIVTTDFGARVAG